MINKIQVLGVHDVFKFVITYFLHKLQNRFTQKY